MLSTPRRWPMRKSHEWARVEFVKRGKIGYDAVIEGVSVVDVEKIEVMGHAWAESSRDDGEQSVISQEGYLKGKFGESL
jgi:hypothetical protein